MKRIGLLSDTHGYWDDRYETYFKDCDEIWHAGDIGSTELAERFEAMKTFRAVCVATPTAATFAVCSQQHCASNVRMPTS